MGGFFSKAWNKLFGKPEIPLLMVGLDAAGKTTILYRLKLGEVRTTVPTIGFNVDTVEYKNLKFTVWDVGGQDKLRPMWRHYYADTKGLIFVVDSADVDRIDTGPDNARQELLKMLEEDALDGVPLLILANKQDLPGALSAEEMKSRLGVSMMSNRRVGVFAACASDENHEGLAKGLDWLADVLTGNFEGANATVDEVKSSA
eukprot:TRINITY_DN4272_c0_g1_i2.p1 TRINITY_DN4272_c0_g1~~TRINITY_DN4272_c0_g1_i2.p1  ORF type:complete len:202 (-),score=44.37 TRINITY_DN4272_c0_g1_i2:1300-1905(-)